MKELTVILGFRCNLSCQHCCSRSGPKNKEFDLLASEKKRLTEVISRQRPRRLHFGGGEPTLYIDTINELCSSHPELQATRVEIVTNGWFAVSQQKIASILIQFRRLSKIHMSFDAHHGGENSVEKVILLARYCRENSIDFQVATAISSPTDLIGLRELVPHLDLPISFQPVRKVGRAVDNGVEFKYSVFDREVLSRKCPSEGQISFTPRKGFSICCSSLVFDDLWAAASDLDLERYRRSEFHADLTSLTFAELAQKYQVEIDQNDPSLSDECGLCRKIFLARRHRETRQQQTVG